MTTNSLQGPTMSDVEPTADANTEALLRSFLLSSPAALAAASSLREGAEVGLSVADMPLEWRFFSADGQPALQATKAQDPDFELCFTRAALATLCSLTDADLGDFGIAFFERIASRDPENRIRVQVRSGLIKLTRRGWLGLLARGGPKLAAWMGKKGLRGPGAVMTALSRMKSKQP